eukprot:2890890-Amphidinium_carterae.3
MNITCCPVNKVFCSLAPVPGFAFFGLRVGAVPWPPGVAAMLAYYRSPCFFHIPPRRRPNHRTIEGMTITIYIMPGAWPANK